MTMTDPIADLLARIRNAQMVGKKTVHVPASTLKEALLNILKDQGYIAAFSKREIRQNISMYDVELKYHEGRPAIVELKKVSTPGRRVYKQASDLPSVKGGLGVAVVSTSKGLLTDAQARNMNLGGEVICYIY